MNKAELIEALTGPLGSRAAATRAVESMVDVILRQVAGGGSVAITGFGTFENVQRAPRTGRNPRTGEAVPIEGTASPRFRPGNYFKDVVRDPATLPQDGLAGGRASPANRTASGDDTHSGAPPTVRKTAEALGTDKASPAEPRRRSANAQASGTGGASSPVSGTPESVRATEDEAAEAAADAASAPASGGRVLDGGEDITMGMITAKKAQLAKVKNDEIAAKEKKKAKAEGKKKKKKKKAKKSD